MVDSSAENWEFQLRTSGVWNSTGVQIDIASLHLGRDFRIEAGGEWIRTFEVGRNQDALIPHVNFDETGSNSPHAPVLDEKVLRVILQPIDTFELIAKDHPQLFVTSTLGLRTANHLKIGSVAATAPVTVRGERGGTGGTIFFEREYPASAFGPADTEVTIDFEGFVEVPTGILIDFSFHSSVAFALKTNGPPLDNAWVAVDLTLLDEQDFILDNLTFSDELDLTMDRELNFTVGRFF